MSLEMPLPESDDDAPTAPGATAYRIHDKGDRDSVVTARHSRGLPDGLQFGKYRVVRLLGVGGMSEIYEAVHLGLEKHVALKVMRRELAETIEARQRFIAEGIHAARVRHTNVVDVTDVGEIDALPYLVMNLLEGEDLGRVFDRQGRLSIPDIVDILLPVASAVARGHELGVVHRDLKPDNIFLHREGNRVIPKVLDFGVSCVMTARRITLNSSVFGTPHYMSPEQARGAPTDERADQYSFGVILYEGLTGRLPRDSTNPLALLHAVAYGSFQPPSEHFELPPDLEYVILRAMAREPEQRFNSMRDLAVALLPFASEPAREYWSVELGLVAPGTRPSEPPVPWLARRPSPVPHPVAQLASADRTGPVRKHSQAIVLARRVSSVPPPPTPTRALVHGAPQAGAAVLEPRAVRHPRKRERLAWLAAALLPLLAVGGLWVWRREPPPQASVVTAAPEPAPSFEVDVRTTPSDATLALDGRIVAVGHYAGRLERNGVEHALHVSAPGHEAVEVRFRDTAPPREIRLEPTAQEPATPHERQARASHRSPTASGPARTETAPASNARPPIHVRTVSESRLQPPTPALHRAETSETVPTPPEKVSIVDAPAENPRVAVVEPARPKVRLVDEDEPKVELIE